jgi:uncharacterized membrane protein YbaN (DUF454 family)
MGVVSSTPFILLIVFFLEKKEKYFSYILEQNLASKGKELQK